MQTHWEAVGLGNGSYDAPGTRATERCASHDSSLHQPITSLPTPSARPKQAVPEEKTQAQVIWLIWIWTETPSEEAGRPGSARPHHHAYPISVD